MCQHHSKADGRTATGAILLARPEAGRSPTQPAAMPQDSGKDHVQVLIKDACILTMDNQIGDYACADILIDGDTIAAIGSGLAQCISAPVQTIDGRGKIVVPGFVDTHHHQFETALRSSLADGILSGDPAQPEYPNYMERILGRLAPAYRPEDVYISELYGSLSQLDAGVTSVLDVSQIHHSPEHTDAAVAALLDAGRRAVLGYFEGQGLACRYPHDIFRLQRRYFAGTQSQVTLAMGGEVYLPEWERAWQLARELGLQIVFHCVGGMGSQAVMDDLISRGLLRDDNLIIHMTGINQPAWKAVAEAGAAISLAVPIEMAMRHGTPPLLHAQAAGIMPSLSSDVECTMTADFFTQMRCALTLQRGLVNELALEGDHTFAPVSAREVLQWATIGGARALRLASQTGSLSPGKQADLILLDSEALNVSPLNHAPGAVVTLMERSNVDTVMVAGRIRKWQGRLVGVDVPSLTRKLEASRDYLFEKAGLARVLF